MTKQDEKHQLRCRIRKISLSDHYKTASSQAIAAHLIAMPVYQSAETVFCFVGTDQEMNTRPILEDVLAAGKTLCVPLCVAKGVMEPRRITSLDQLSPGAYGILEPSFDTPVISPDAIDLALIPCVTCSRAGHRLGKGGGYYDRFLAHYRGAMILLCWEQLIREEIPVEPHDYPIPWVLTERGLYEDGIPARLG